MICYKCGDEVEALEGLCTVCHAEELEPGAEVVESGRPRYEGSGARLDTKFSTTTTEEIGR